MWLDGPRLDAVGSALATGDTPEVDQLLADIFGGVTSQAAIPTACPTCRRDLVRSPLQPLSLFVSACPERHGAWMSPQELGEFHCFVESEVTLAAKKRHRLRVLGRALALASVAVAGAIALSFAIAAQRVALPSALAPTTLAREEWVYFQQLMTTLDRGISNRLGMEGTLKTKVRPEEYAAGYADYREQQADFLVSLRRLDVPAKLRPLHDRIIVATERQIEFYEAFVAAKSADPSVNHARMRHHPALASMDRELRAAYDLVKRLYPTLDHRIDEALDQRLCAFDALDDSGS